MYHFRELFRSSNSGTVITRVFPSQTRRFVKDVSEDEAALGARLGAPDGSTPVVLYPGEGSVSVAELKALMVQLLGQGTAPAAKPASSSFQSSVAQVMTQNRRAKQLSMVQ